MERKILLRYYVYRDFYPKRQHRVRTQTFYHKTIKHYPEAITSIYLYLYSIYSNVTFVYICCIRLLYTLEYKQIGNDTIINNSPLYWYRLYYDTEKFQIPYILIYINKILPPPWCPPAFIFVCDTSRMV